MISARSGGSDAKIGSWRAGRAQIHRTAELRDHHFGQNEATQARRKSAAGPGVEDLEVTISLGES